MSYFDYSEHTLTDLDINNAAHAELAQRILQGVDEATSEWMEQDDGYLARYYDAMQDFGATAAVESLAAAWLDWFANYKVYGTGFVLSGGGKAVEHFDAAHKLKLVMNEHGGARALVDLMSDALYFHDAYTLIPTHGYHLVRDTLMALDAPQGEWLPSPVPANVARYLDALKAAATDSQARERLEAIQCNHNYELQRESGDWVLQVTQPMAILVRPLPERVADFLRGELERDEGEALPLLNALLDCLEQAGH